MHAGLFAFSLLKEEGEREETGMGARGNRRASYCVAYLEGADVGKDNELLGGRNIF
jgi:hypothetical protein